MGEGSGVREWRGWAHPQDLERFATEEERGRAVCVRATRKEPSDQIQVRVIARLPGEPDGLPVGMMSTWGEVQSHPMKGENYPWVQSAKNDGRTPTHYNSAALKPASLPETYAVVYDGLSAETAEFLAKIQGGRVVRSSELEKPDA